MFGREQIEGLRRNCSRLEDSNSLLHKELRTRDILLNKEISHLNKKNNQLHIYMSLYDAIGIKYHKIITHQEYDRKTDTCYDQYKLVRLEDDSALLTDVLEEEKRLQVLIDKKNKTLKEQSINGNN